jgi:xanthine dehydrogenase YagR molybdenum-binding subunit
MEHTVVAPNTTRVVNPNLSTYLVPVCADTPSVETIFVNGPDSTSSGLDARGFGETRGRVSPPRSATRSSTPPAAASATSRSPGTS